MSALHRDADGTLPAYAWPGGYQILYIADDGATFCSACANGENGSLASETAEPCSGWRIVGAQIHWEGPPEVCAHCGDLILCAYGDPEEVQS